MGRGFQNQQCQFEYNFSESTWTIFYSKICLESTIHWLFPFRRFQVVFNAQSQITRINHIFYKCNLTLSVIYDMKTAI
jgi:hypothetical protein